jgi:hypothetical protein
MLDFDLEKTSGVRQYGVRPSVGFNKGKRGTVFLCNEGKWRMQFSGNSDGRGEMALSMLTLGVSLVGRNVINDFSISLVHQFHNSFSNAPACLVSSTSNTIGMDDPSPAIYKYFALQS